MCDFVTSVNIDPCNKTESSNQGKVNRFSKSKPLIFAFHVIFKTFLSKMKN